VEFALANGLTRRAPEEERVSGDPRQGGVGDSGVPEQMNAPERLAMPSTELDGFGSREHSAAISNLVGGLVREYLGQRPKAHTYLKGDAITVVLRDTLTKGEQRLVRDGLSELVLYTRRAFQQPLREDLIAGIEQITGRRVRVCANDMKTDITVETFVLDGSCGGDISGNAR
jgi:uncharacterized protein YbcI